MFYTEIHDLFTHIIIYQNKYNIIITLKIKIMYEYDVPILLQNYNVSIMVNTYYNISFDPILCSY